MEIPEKIKVAGHWVEVKRDYKYKERGDLLGQAKYSGNTITLIERREGTVDEVAESSEAENFLHEMFHHVNCKYNNNDLKEEQVGRLAVGLFQVLRDNKLKFWVDDV